VKASTSAFGIVLVVALLALLPAACAPSASARTTKHIEVTSVDEKATVFELIDLGAEDFGPGDQLFERAPVTDADGETIGETITTVAIVDGTGMADMVGVVDCTVELAEGNILFHGAFSGADLGTGATVPIVGGTGDYVGATGTAMMVAPSEKETKLTLDMTLPGTP